MLEWLEGVALLAWLPRAWRWVKHQCVARPKFLGTQQRASYATRDTAFWFVCMRLAGPSFGSSLRACRVRMFIDEFEPFVTGPSPGLQDHPITNRPRGLRWQDDPGENAVKERDLHKNIVYTVPIAIRTVGERQEDRAAHLTSELFFSDPTQNPLDPGRYYFRLELQSGGLPPWLSPERYLIVVPERDMSNTHFYVEPWYNDQHRQRLESDGTR